MERSWYSRYDNGVPHTISYPDGPLSRFLEAAARNYPNNVATIFFNAKLTYREINDAANRLAHALQELGVKKGDRVALVLPNCPQFVIAYYAALKIGAVVVPTNPTYKPREFEYQFKDAGAETVIALNLFVPAIQEIQPATQIKNIICTYIKEYLPPIVAQIYPLKERREKTFVKIALKPGIYNFADLIKRTTPYHAPVEISGDDLALLQYTGGTTGRSKGAMLTHRNLVANTLQVKAWLCDVKEDGSEVFLAATPFFHVYGMTVVMSFAVAIASPMVLLPRWQTKEALHSIQKYKATTFSGVPTMYVAINNFPDVKKYDLSSIRVCISGAAPLPQEVGLAFEKLTGGSLREGYGLTEAAPVTHCNPCFQPSNVGSIGVPFPDVDAKIVDPETHADLPLGEIGELALRGPQVMKGYWNNAQETAQVLQKEWLYTGDMARQDQDGYFYIVDRKKDIIIAGGFNIYPRDVEEVLYEHPKVLEAVVAGVPDQYRGETVKAYIVLREGQTATAEEIIAFCRERLASFKAPKLVEFRASLPKSLVGKHLRRVLLEEERERLKANPAPAPKAPATSGRRK